MPDKFDNFVVQLQQKIIKEDIKDHSEKIVKLFYNPKNWGKPLKEEITLFEERRGGQKGYLLGLYLKIVDNKIIKANFITDGCGAMVATASQTTILIEGKSLKFAKNLKPEDIETSLEGLYKDEKHYTDYVLEILRGIIEKYKQN
ncbi:MAG: iron-sulfur cluster assembly scaffold protein [Promethearchaeota archaeon]